MQSILHFGVSGYRSRHPGCWPRSDPACDWDGVASCLVFIREGIFQCGCARLQRSSLLCALCHEDASRSIQDLVHCIQHGTRFKSKGSQICTRSRSRQTDHSPRGSSLPLAFTSFVCSVTSQRRAEAEMHHAKLPRRYQKTFGGLPGRSCLSPFSQLQHCPCLSAVKPRGPFGVVPVQVRTSSSQIGCGLA